MRNNCDEFGRFMPEYMGDLLLHGYKFKRCEFLDPTLFESIDDF
jgi:hypothetical protein